MITQPESGLTQEQYDLLFNTGVKPSYQVMISQYNLALERYDVDTSNSDTRNFAVEICPLGLFRAIDGGLYRSTDGSVWNTTGVTYGGSLTFLLYDNAKIYFYYSESNSLKRKESNNGTSWSGATTLFTLPDNTYLVAASRYNRVHAVTRRESDKFNTRFFCWDNGSLIWSELYWTHIIDGLGAVKVDEKSDCIVVSTPLPPIVGLRPEGSSVSLLSFKASGLISFIYQNNRWSDHHNIEIFDDTNLWLRRLYLRAKKVGDYVIAAAYAADGTQEYFTESMQIYRSKNGRFWEQGYPVITRDFRRGGLLGVYGDYAYLIGARAVYRCYKTEYVDNEAAEAITYDLTPYVEEFNRSFGQISQTNMRVQNPGNRTLKNTLLGEKAVLMMKLYVGYVVNGEVLRILIATDEIESIRSPDELPVRSINLSTRDHGAWLVDKVVAHHIVERETGVIGPDDFIDDTGTGYGGLRHTAVQVGNWRTLDKSLLLSNNNERGIAFSTYDTDGWNGSLQFKFRLPTPVDPPEGYQNFAGIVFRAYDKDNCYYVRARNDPTGNHIEIGQVRGGVDTVLGLSTTLLPALDTFYALKVVTRYQRVEVYYANEIGTDWQNILWDGNTDFIINSETQGRDPVTWSPNTTYPVMVERGFWGYDGWGYSNMDDWGAWGDPTIPDAPPFNDTPEPPELPYGDDCDDYDWSLADPGDGPADCIDLTDYGFGTVFALYAQKLMRTDNFSGANPTWREVVSISGVSSSNLNDFEIDPFSPAILGTGDQIGIFLLTNNAIWHCADANDPNWIKKCDLTNEYTILKALHGEEGGAVAYSPTADEVTLTPVTHEIYFDGDNPTIGDGWTVKSFRQNGSTLAPLAAPPPAGSSQAAAHRSRTNNKTSNYDNHFAFIQIEFDTPIDINGGDKFKWRQYHGPLTYSPLGAKHWLEVYFYDASGNLVDSCHQASEVSGPPPNEWKWEDVAHPFQIHGRTVKNVSKIVLKEHSTWGDNSVFIDQINVSGFSSDTAGAKTAYVNAENDLVEQSFGHSGNESQGLDVDAYGMGILRTVANGHLYETHEGYGETPVEIATLESVIAYRVNGIVVFKKRMDGLDNDSEPDIHALVHYNLRSTDLNPDEPIRSARRTEHDFEFYDDAGNLIPFSVLISPTQSVGEKMNFAPISPFDQTLGQFTTGGPYGVAVFGDNPRFIAWAGYPIDQWELEPNARDYRVFVFMLQEDDEYSYEMTDPGMRHDMICFSPRNKSNLYACGFDGVGYRKAGKPWRNKNGNLETLLGSVPRFLKIQPLVPLY